jgi:hypothetical protein
MARRGYRRKNVGLQSHCPEPVEAGERMQDRKAAAPEPIETGERR